MAETDDFEEEARVQAYLAGRLSDDARLAFEAEMAKNPDLAANVALSQAVRGVFSEMEEAPSPGALGWARLNRSLEAPVAVVPSRAPIWQLAAAAVVAGVAVWQGNTLLNQGNIPEGYVPATEAVIEGVTATVAFQTAATEAEIRALLRETGGEIVGGPNALGLWVVRFETLDARVAALANMQTR